MIPTAKKRWGFNKPPSGCQINWNHPITRGLQGCWLLNEDSGKPFNLVTNVQETFGAVSPTWATIGMSFSGSNNCAINLAIKKYNLSSAPGATMTSIFKPAASQADSAGCLFWIDRGITGSTRIALVRSNANKIITYARSATESLLNATSSTTITDNRWYLTTGVIKLGTSSTGRIGIWIDGKLDIEDTESFGQSTFADTTPIQPRIGDDDGGSSTYRGDVSIVYMHNRTLQPEEIKWLHAEPYGFIEPIKQKFYIYVEEAAPETITVDKWHREPVLPQRYPLEVVSY